MAFPAQGGPDPLYRRGLSRTLSSVLSAITGAGGRAVVNALINGERAPQTLAEPAIRRARSKIPVLIEALDGTFTEHHAFMCPHYLDELDHLAAAVGQLDTRITALPARLERDTDIENSTRFPVSDPRPLRSSSPRPAATWPGLPPPGISPPGSRSARG